MSRDRETNRTKKKNFAYKINIFHNGQTIIKAIIKVKDI